MEQFDERALTLLRQLTGVPNTEFRDGQLEAIKAIAKDRSRALVIQRTGWGKSAVYLISTRILRDERAGPTVIVSPLLVLMRNQIEMTQRLGLNAKTVDSTNIDDWSETFDEIKASKLDLLLISPERLNNVEFRRDVMSHLFNNVGLLVIDEVHCISDWGHDFRPDYRRLRQVVDALPPNIPVLGTTATANDRVIADVEDQLGDDLRVFRGTLERDSMSLHVLTIENKAERMAWLATTIPGLSGSGIVYCLTILDAIRVGDWLRAQGIEAASYTGDMEHVARLEVEERLTAGDLKAVVATSALAMGYDNPKIEFVIHYQTPGSAIAYYQQVGRAGRAVDESYGIAMSGWEDADIQDYFISTAFPSEHDCNLVLTRLRSADDGLKLGAIEEIVNLRRSRLTAMLKILEVEGAVYRDGPKWRRSAQPWTYPGERVSAITAERRAEQAAMQRYISTDACLMEFLRLQLDDPNAERCGRCANCVGPMFSTDLDGALVEKALAHLRKTVLDIAPRKVVPCDLGIEIDLRNNPIEVGRCLARWGDPGLARLVERAKYREEQIDDRLVEAATDLMSEWAPLPSPVWLTWIPSSSSGDLVEDFAHRLATKVGIEAVETFKRVRSSQPQKTMQNSCQQARNIAGAFAIVDSRPGPVLLVDDVVDSRWTFTILGSQLRSATGHPVYPLALADTSGRGA